MPLTTAAAARARPGHGLRYGNKDDYGRRDPKGFLQRIEGIYHRDGAGYTNAVMGIIRAHRLNG